MYICKYHFVTLSNCLGFNSHISTARSCTVYRYAAIVHGKNIGLRDFSKQNVPISK
jgi:hypothetical protein